MALNSFANPAVQNTFLLTGNTPTNGVTATASGTQATGFLVTTPWTRVTTVGTAADSLLLPVSLPGLELTIVNAAAANAMTIYPQVGDAINALSANTGLSVVANKTIKFVCMVAGTWNTLLTA